MTRSGTARRPGIPGTTTTVPKQPVSKTVPKQPVSKTVPTQPVPKTVPTRLPIPSKYANMDWEEINTYLHGKYPNSKPGVLCLKSFKAVPAIADCDELVEIDKKNFPDLDLIKTWIKKVYDAI